MAQMKSILKENSIIHHMPFQHLLSETQKVELTTTSFLNEYTKRDIILKQNAKVDSVPFIISGLVKVSREMRRGKNIILRIAQPGMFLGLPSVFNHDYYEYSAFAIEPTRVGFVDINIFKLVFQKNGEFGHEIAKQLAQDDLFNINRLSSLLYKQLPGRVADIILYFSKEIYNCDTFTIPLTRQELAELAGTTKESLIRTLSEFKHDKIIEMNRNNFTISSLNIINTLSRLG